MLILAWLVYSYFSLNVYVTAVMVKFQDIMRKCREFQGNQEGFYMSASLETLCVLSVSRLLRLLEVLHKYHFLLEL